MITFERTYATYKYLTYGNDSKNRSLIYLVIALDFLPVLIFQALSLKNLQQNQQQEQQLTLAMTSYWAFSGRTLSIVIGLLSIVIATLCTTVLLVNKIWNRYKLRNYDWFNRCKFDLKSRIQLSQNIDTNQSIFCMTLLFLLAFVVTVSIAIPLSMFEVAKNELQDANAIFYVVMVQQLYCLLYIFIYVAASEKMRRKILQKKNLVMSKATMVVASISCNLFKKQNKILPATCVLDQAKDRYFQELVNMWNWMVSGIFIILDSMYSRNLDCVS